MKILGVLVLLIASSLVYAQEKTKPTSEFSISGKVKTDLLISTSDFSSFEIRNIGDLKITNHLGAEKDIAKDLKGVLLKDIFSRVEIQAENPKILSEFYITCIASDGYKIVFSWNELFNTETGNHVYLITEKEGIKATDLSERILLVSTTDFKTGRRYLRGLTKIIVERVP
jgi:hypothetical protein